MKIKQSPVEETITDTGPLVSVVIPTRDRPHLVVRAVQSALKQTLDAIEVIVVIDGPDEATLQVLRQIDDPRLRILMLPVSHGGGDARNAGVMDAQSQWVALLDDDDEWFSRKLEIQIQAAGQPSCLYPIITCRLIARSEGGDLVWPRRFPSPREPLSEYMFCQSSLLAGEGLVLTSTILTKKDLLLKTPFTSGLSRHHDIDWLLRASTLEGFGIEFVASPVPLVIWHIEENRRRISNTGDWRYSLSWIQANRHLVTPRAYASFLMTWASSTAARGRDWKAFWLLPREAYRHGKPKIIDLLAHLVIWFIPSEVRRRMTIFIKKRHLAKDRLDKSEPEDG